MQSHGKAPEGLKDALLVRILDNHFGAIGRFQILQGLLNFIFFRILEGLQAVIPVPDQSRAVLLI